MSKYLIEFKRHTASIIADFDEKGRIISAIVDYGNMEEQQFDYLLRKFPTSLSRLEYYRTMQNVVITEVPEDLSFERFWNTYGNKVGKKKTAQRLWEVLSDAEKHKAMKHIQPYKQWLAQRTGIEMKYPETYLSQEPWNN